MHEVDSAGIAEELKRLEEAPEAPSAIGDMPAQGAGGNIDILDGGISVGQFANGDGTFTPTLVVSITFAIRMGNDGAVKMAESLAEVAGKRVIIKPHMVVPRG